MIENTTTVALKEIQLFPRATICNAKGNKVQLEGWSHVCKKIVDPPPTTFLSYLKKHGFPKWMYAKHNFEKFRTIAQIQTFFQNNLRIVTDASLRERGTACVIFETMDQKENLIFITKVPANSTGISINDSYRSELTGILAALTLLQIVEKITGNTNQIQLACDNLRAINVSNTYKYVNTRQQHFDVIRAILETKKRVTSQIKYIHVRGHLDNTNKFQDLNRLEQLNIICDRYAKEANGYLPAQPLVHFEHEGLSLWHNNDRKIYSSFKANILSIYWDEKAVTTICTKYGWDDETFHMINWEASGKAMQMMTTSLQI